MTPRSATSRGFAFWLLWAALGGVVVAGSAIDASAHGKPRTVCSDARYLIDSTQAGAEPQAVVVSGSQVTFDLPDCGRPGRTWIRAGRRATRLVARWSSCGESGEPVWLQARIRAPECTDMTGSWKARHQRPRFFTARRSVCGDGVVDREGGEECEPPGTRRCDATCSRVRVSGSFHGLTYNVAGLPEGLSGSHPALHMPLIGPLLNDYDLVLVQESWQTPEPNPLAPLRVYHEILEDAATHPYRSEPAPLPLGSDPRRPEALVGDGLNRFSDFSFTEVVRQAWLECFETSADCLALKGFSVARTALAPGIEADVYNLHMEAGGDPEDDRLREQAVDQLADFLETFSTGRSVIVGGDFNLHSDTDPDAGIFQRLQLRTGLADVCDALSCPEPGRIDKFLFRSSDDLTLVPTSWRFETDVFVRDDGEPLSDHDALAVRFDWVGTPAD